MRLNKLEISDFRCLSRVSIETGSASWIVLSGGNGAGKTSVMEAIYAATRGRSFRAAASSDMVCTGRDAAEIRIVSRDERERRVGARFSRFSRELHLDGRLVQGVAEVSAAIPVEYVGGASHRLVDGPPAARRRFMDWALFHVEPRFLETWRHWHRAHRQRNAWMRQGEYSASEGWTQAVCAHGETLSGMREALIRRLAGRLGVSWDATIQSRRAQLRFRRGWRGDSLAEAFDHTRERERRLGRAIVGPQSDDWSLDFDGLAAEQLSRGQSKLASLFLWRELGRMMIEAGRPTVLLADDFLADLDGGSVRAAIAALEGAAGQVWLAMQDRPGSLALPEEAVWFHVEQGRVRP